MDEQRDCIFQEYKLYTELKDRFVDRNFNTNKFYLIATIAVVVGIYLMKDYTFDYGITAPIVLSLIGMGICVLWWLNIDSYETLIKVKLGSVIDKLEEMLPVQPHGFERDALRDLKKKKVFVFSDIQKSMAVGSFIIFVVFFALELFTIFLNYHFHSTTM